VDTFSRWTTCRWTPRWVTRSQCLRTDITREWVRCTILRWWWCLRTRISTWAFRRCRASRRPCTTQCATRTTRRLRSGLRRTLDRISRTRVSTARTVAGARCRTLGSGLSGGCSSCARTTTSLKDSRISRSRRRLWASSRRQRCARRSWRATARVSSATTLIRRRSCVPSPISSRPSSALWISSRSGTFI